MRPPRIVLLHATAIAMAPVLSAFRSVWPEAEALNLLDDGLTVDRARSIDLTEEMIERFVDFGRYGVRIGADGILVTCSAFGPAIERLSDLVDVPVVKPNDAMFRAALQNGSRVGMLATFGPSIPTMESEFYAYAGSKASLTTVLVDGAIERLREGDSETHNSLVARQAAKLADMDAVMLAHFSTSAAAPNVRQVIGVPVLTAPESAVLSMRALVEG